MILLGVAALGRAEEPGKETPAREPQRESAAEASAAVSVSVTRRTAPAEDQSAVPAPQQTVLLDGALPAESLAEGEWLWETEAASGGVRVHGHPAGAGLQRHGVSFPPVTVPVGSLITQRVWLDPADPPRGISLRLALEGGREIGVYWEGEEEVFTPRGFREMWYYGELPVYGEWVTLEVLAEDLDLRDLTVTGLGFETFDGRALWGKTAFVEAPESEEAEAVEFPTPQLPGGN